MIQTRTPLRISLCGGGTDLPEHFVWNPGAVISFAIDKYVYVSVNKKFDGKIRMSYSKTENVNTVNDLQHDLARETLKMFGIKNGIEVTSVSDIPGEGSGLGSSSAFTVGLIKALGRDITPYALAERAYTIEREKCRHPVGKQDQYASALGGLNYIHFSKSKVRHVNFIGSKWDAEENQWNLNDLNSWILLLWTGQTRSANTILKSQASKLRNDSYNGKVMYDLTNELYVKMQNGITPKQLGSILHSAWHLKRKMADGVSDAYLDFLYQAAMTQGAYGGKICGAGGGGFMLFVADPENHDRIAKATKLPKVDFKIVHQGSEVIYGK